MNTNSALVISDIVYNEKGEYDAECILSLFYTLHKIYTKKNTY
jgi:hypothetical protein